MDRKNGWLDKQGEKMDGWMDGQGKIWMDGYNKEWIVGLIEKMDFCIYRKKQRKRWMFGQMDMKQDDKTINRDGWLDINK